MELEHRVIRLELIAEDHAIELKKLQDISEDLRKSLASIEKTLAQIRWLATGAVLAIVANSVGVMELIKIVM